MVWDMRKVGAYQEVDSQCSHTRGKANVLLEQAEEGVGSGCVDTKVQGLQHHPFHAQQVLSLHTHTLGQSLSIFRPHPSFKVS